MEAPKSSCSVCQKIAGEDCDIKQCSACKTRRYCSIDCQRVDWPTHKSECNKNKGSAKWYDCHRLCPDGSEHFGDLELVTWKCPADGTGWGNVFVEEEEYMKKKFTEEFGGDLRKLFHHWPQAFRWRCCGMDGSMTWGCDHHGTGAKPCTCDFCKMGEPLSDDIYLEQSAARMGLTLPRGPNPCSRNPFTGPMIGALRDITALFDESMSSQR